MDESGFDEIFACERRGDKVIVGYNIDAFAKDIISKNVAKIGRIKRAYALIDTKNGVWTWRLMVDSFGRVSRKRDIVGIETKKAIFRYMALNPDSKINLDIERFDIEQPSLAKWLKEKLGLEK